MDKKVYKFYTTNTYGLRNSSKFVNVVNAELKCVKADISNLNEEEKYYYNGYICFVVGDNIISFNGDIADKIVCDSEIYLIKEYVVGLIFPFLDKSTFSNQSKHREYKTYLMIDTINGYVKIGKSENPKARERTLQSEKPSIKLMCICDVCVEEELHDKYDKFRIRGEWFNLTKRQIDNICKKYNFQKVANFK